MRSGRRRPAHDDDQIPAIVGQVDGKAPLRMIATLVDQAVFALWRADAVKVDLLIQIELPELLCVPARRSRRSKTRPLQASRPARRTSANETFRPKSVRFSTSMTRDDRQSVPDSETPYVMRRPSGVK